MSLYAIAKIYNGKQFTGVRVFDTKSETVKDIPLNGLKAGMAKGIVVDNLELISGELKGINGSLDRYSSINVNGNLTSDSAFVIVSKLEDKGYTVVDYSGKVKNYRTEDVLRLVNEKGLKVANGKIVPKDGAQVVSAIDGAYNTVKIGVPDKKSTKSELRREVVQADNKEDKVVYMRHLVDKLNAARKTYEQEDREIMSNYEYDKLYDELLDLEDELGGALPNSPTKNVGYEVVSKLTKEKHGSVMLSLDKTKDIDILEEFLGNKEGELSWKMDGLTIVLTYSNGNLIKAVTRGNGEIGEVVTANAKQFKNIPLRIAFKGDLVVRGEAVIKYSDFERINDKIVDVDAKYKNPRNLCSGSVRQLNSEVTAQRNVMFFAFNLVKANGVVNSSVAGQLNFLKELRFETVESVRVNKNNLADVIKQFADKIASYDIPSDGLVLTYNDVAYGVSLGNTSKFPRHSIAFKWKDEAAETTLTGIEWSPSRTGLINPVALFKPVDIEGSTVARASIHNISIMEALELGVGDTITVYKANMIIPQILDNLTRSDTCEIPDVCTSCGGDTEIFEDPSSGVRTLYCTNKECPAKSIKLFTHFVNRDAMNIDGLSEATLGRLVEEGMIEAFADIYDLEQYEDTIINMEGFGRKSYDNLINSVDRSRDVRLANLVYALGIPNVGLSTAKLIAKHCKYDLMNFIKVTYQEMLGIDGIGETIAESVHDWLNNPVTAKNFVDLLEEIDIIEESVSTDTSMDNLVFCCTGKLNIFDNRDAVKELIENKGGKLTGSVTNNTTYLITNDTTSGSTKNKKAQQLGVQIITEQEFIDKFDVSI